MLKLTDAAIEALPPPTGLTASGKPKKDYVRAFAEPRNLRIRVTASDKFFQADTPSGPVPLGRYGDLTPKAAAKAAKAVAGDVAKGLDPVAQRRTARVEQRKAAAAAKAQAAEHAFTVRKLIERWASARADRGRRASYLDIAQGTLELHLADWLDRPAASITPREASARLEEIKTPKIDERKRPTGGPIAANRSLAYGRAAFSWAKSRHLITANPFDGLEAPGQQRPRERALNRDEVGAVWRASASLIKPYGSFVRLLLLTLMRRDEVAGLPWIEISGDGTAWTLPPERSKNHKAHTTVLTAAAREVIGFTRTKDCPFVFPAASEEPISAFSYAKRLLDKAIAKDLGASIAPWTFHDIRRTGVTCLAEMGFPPHVCDRLLNHVAGAALGMLPAVYQKAEFASERKAALEAWSEYVLAAAERRKTADNVAELRRRAG